MKYKNALNLFAGIFLAAIALSAAPTAQAGQCSLAGVAGNWGFTTNGTVVGIGPRVSVGIFTLDGAGKILNGKATASLNGSVTDETFSGTYTVNPDCTGTFAINIFDLSGTNILTARLNLVIDANEQEVRSIFTSIALPNGTPLASVITAETKRIFTDTENN